MFFSISKIQNNSFPNHIRSGNLFIDFDDGWTVNKTSITKGYNGKGCEILFDSIGFSLEILTVVQMHTQKIENSPHLQKLGQKYFLLILFHN